MTDSGVVVGEVPDSSAERGVPTSAPAGDPYHGFDAWYLTAWPRLQQVITAYCGSRSVAIEVAAEVFVLAAERWPDAARRPRNPDAWSTTVAFNVLKRQRHRSKLEEDAQWDIAPEPTPPYRDLDLWAAITRLPPRMRQAVVLRYIGDFTQPMVAAAMQTSDGNVAAMLSQARKRIALDTAVSPRHETGRN